MSSSPSLSGYLLPSTSRLKVIYDFREGFTRQFGGASGTRQEVLKKWYKFMADRRVCPGILPAPKFSYKDGKVAMDTTDFEAELKQNLLLDQLRTMMVEGMWVSDLEVDQKIRQEKEQASVKAVQLRYERFLSEVSLDDGAAREYFDSHSEDFRREEERVIRYLVVDTNKLRRLLEVQDADLESYYNEHTNDFREGELHRPID